MAEKSDVLAVAAAFYEAAMQADGWPTALSRVGDLLNSTWSVLSASSRDGRTKFLTQDTAGDPGHLAAFSAGFDQPETNPAIPALLAAGQGAIILREQNISDADWLSCGLYRQIYRPMGLYYGLGAFVLSSPSHAALIGINRPKAGGAFTPRELALLRQTLPHLRRALEVFLKLEEAGMRNLGNEAVWDALACGVVLVDDSGKVLWTNRSATRTLALAEGLAIRNGLLAAARPSENLALQALIRESVATTQVRSLASGGSLSVTRPSRLRSLALLVSPVRLEPSFVRRPAAVVFVTDPELTPELPPQMLKRLYGLTGREAALATLLLRGANLRDAAAQLGVSMHTARTYLRFIFRKTATRRQSALIALLLRGPAGLG